MLKNIVNTLTAKDARGESILDVCLGGLAMLATLFAFAILFLVALPPA